MSFISTPSMTLHPYGFRFFLSYFLHVDEILVCIGLLDTFAIHYYKMYGGAEAARETEAITIATFDMERSLSYGRKANGPNRVKCVKSMQDIMNRIKTLSSQKSDDSAAKLKSKLKMLVSAREQELQAWRELEQKHPSPQITSFMREFKSESFDAGA